MRYVANKLKILQILKPDSERKNRPHGAYQNGDTILCVKNPQYATGLDFYSSKPPGEITTPNLLGSNVSVSSILSN